MHVSPAKHSYAWLPKKVWLPDRHKHGRTDRQTPDKVIPMCRYASQATQKSLEKYNQSPDCRRDKRISLVVDCKSSTQEWDYLVPSAMWWHILSFSPLRDNFRASTQDGGMSKYFSTSFSSLSCKQMAYISTLITVNVIFLEKKYMYMYY